MVRSFYVALLLSSCVLGFGSLSFADESPESSSAEHGPDDSGHGEAASGSSPDHGNEHDGPAHQEAHGGGHGNTNPLSIDPDLLIFTLLAFVVTYVVMSKFAWVPIRDSLEKRDAWIAAQLAEAQVQADSSQQLLHEHQGKLSVATEEVRSLLDQARKDAEAEKQAILDVAQREAAAKKMEALRMIGEARGAALHDLASSSVGTAVDLAGRIVGRPLNKQDHAHLIEDAVQHFTDSSS